MLLFRIPSGARRTSATFTASNYTPADADTKTSGATLKVSGTGASTVAELKADGIVTKFQVTAAPTTTTPSTFRTVQVREPATSTTTTYTYDGSGRVSAITAPLPDGVTTCVPGTATNGCRVLKITYATATTAAAGVPGDFLNQVKKIVAQVNTDADKTLAEYKYDTSGRLVEAKDSRTGLATTYTWTGTGTTLRLATLTPPGQPAFTFGYDTTANKLAKITRPNPATAGGGTAQLAAYVYGVPTSGTGLPDMSITSRWGQEQSPTWGAAVFGPDQVISGTTPAAVTNTDWWKRADLQYTDADGYTINTAGWGAGDWQYTGNDYDTNGNIIRAWDEYGTRWVLAQGLEPGAGEQFATVTKYNDDITSGGTVVTPAGTLVTDVWTPTNWSTPPDDPAAWDILLRTHTKTSYDHGAPNSGIDPNTDQPYRLPTKEVVTVETPDIATATVEEVASITFTGYDKVETVDPKSGWDLGAATTVTTDMDLSDSINSGDITVTTRYDAQGRIIENRQPKSNGSDAGTRETVYYTGDATASVAACRNKPQYAGLVCQVGPKAQPSGQSMPVTTTTAYSWDGQSATEQDISGSVTSTTTTTFTAQDRPATTTTTVTGLSSSTAVPAVTTSYDSATGNVTGTTSTAGSTAMTYDTWGRQLTYTNTPAGQPADTATTTYNQLGQVTKIVDGNGETRYTYDGTDADGNTETRGLVTGLTVKTTGGTEYATTGAYDEAAALVTEKFPGGLRRHTGHDILGQNNYTVYVGTTLDETGTPNGEEPLAEFATYHNAQGQITYEWGPGSDHTYTYDQADRLTKAENDSPYFWTTEGNLGCQTSTYTFDANGNRTEQDSAEPDNNGDCTTSSTNTTRAYDNADRLTGPPPGSWTR